jgi:hypothetical protein
VKHRRWQDLSHDLTMPGGLGYQSSLGLFSQLPLLVRQGEDRRTVLGALVAELTAGVEWVYIAPETPSSVR